MQPESMSPTVDLYCVTPLVKKLSAASCCANSFDFAVSRSPLVACRDQGW